MLGMHPPPHLHPPYPLRTCRYLCHHFSLSYTYIYLYTYIYIYVLLNNRPYLLFIYVHIYILTHALIWWPCPDNYSFHFNTFERDKSVGTADVYKMSQKKYRNDSCSILLMGNSFAALRYHFNLIPFCGNIFSHLKEETRMKWYDFVCMFKWGFPGHYTYDCTYTYIYVYIYRFRLYILFSEQCL